MVTAPTRLDVADGVWLGAVEASDSEALVVHLRDRAIYDNTLRIPRPYTEADARAWISQVAESPRCDGKQVTFAIRNEIGLLIGAIGIEDGGEWASHRAEIGYWLARPYWGRGIMTQVVRRVVHFAFEELQYSRLTAEVFARNQASARVLEKAGFSREGYLRQHVCKDGALLDNIYYGLLREEWDG